MGFTYITSVSGENNASGSTLACDAGGADSNGTLDIVEGDLLIAMACEQVQVINYTSIQDEGGAPANTMTLGAKRSYGGATLCFGYKIAANAKDNSVFTVTYSVTCQYRGLFIMQFRPDSGDTVTVDQAESSTSGGTANPVTNACDPSGDDVVVFAGCVNYGSKTYSSWSIDGTTTGVSSRTSADADTGACIWHKLFTSEQASMTAAVTMAAASWVNQIISFKATAPAGGSPIAVYRKYYDMRRK